ncbi:MAG: LOG family protein [Planctomycetales bacterium]
MIQTEKVQHFPVIFMGRSYWQPMFEFLQERLLKAQTIDQRDMDRILLTDSVSDVMQELERCPVKPADPNKQPSFTRRWWLGE